MRETDNAQRLYQGRQWEYNDLTNRWHKPEGYYAARCIRCGAYIKAGEACRLVWGSKYNWEHVWCSRATAE